MKLAYTSHTIKGKFFVFVCLFDFFFFFLLSLGIERWQYRIPRKKTVVATAAFQPQQPQSYIHTGHRTRRSAICVRKTIVTTAASLPQSPQSYNPTERRESAFGARKQSWQLQHLCYMKPQSYVHTSTKN